MIIADLCGNHNGKKELLVEMVHKAAEAAVNFCKIQSFFAEDLSEEWGHDYHRLKELELNWDDHRKFVETCEKLSVTPITTVYSLKYASLLRQSGFTWVKIASPQARDEVLIRGYKALGFKVIMSTGGWPLNEIPRIHPIEGVLHCVSKYPTPPDESNLSRMIEIKHLWPRTPWGFSDHTDPNDFFANQPSFLALALGARYIERHFTVLPQNATKDGKVSVNFEQLKELCEFDKLQIKEKRAVISHRSFKLGYFLSEQDMNERVLIESYEKRWKSGL